MTSPPRQSRSPIARLRTPQPKSGQRENESGAALVEFALVLPLLLVLVFGIIDFGLYFYNDLQLTHVARDAARFASVGDVAGANAAIVGATLISTSIDSSSVDPASTGSPATVTLTATYSTLTPLPRFVGMGDTIAITATAIMRRE